MANNKQQAKISELERIEFKRRLDIAYSVIHVAARFFYKKGKFEEQIKSESKAAKSYWYWILLSVGIAFHYLWPEGGSGMDLGSWVALMAIGGYFLKQYELSLLRSQRDQCEESCMS